MGENRLKAGLAATVLALTPTASWADRGEGTVSVGTSGSLSFLRSPVLTYERRLPRFSAAIIAVEAAFGLGVTDWLEIGLGGRVVLPTEVHEERVSAQGFPFGDTSYQALTIQVPLSLTGRFTRGGATAFGVHLEAGLDESRWSLLSSVDSIGSGEGFNIAPGSQWSTSFFFGLQPLVEWRHFDHFSFRLGPRLIVSTTGSIHLGMALGGSFLWGLGGF